MGWKDQYTESYILRFWDSQDRSQVLQWIDDADVIIHGRFPIKFVRQRINSGKLTFAYQERYFKRKFSYLKVLFRLHRIIKNYWSVNRGNYHFLAAGAYAAPDLHRIGVFRGRSWKFGYFIEPQARPPVLRKSSQLKIYWCARFSQVKQPHQVVTIALGLKDRGVPFHITMAGDGELRVHIEESVKQQRLTENFSFTGWQSKDQINEQMRAADLFLMTSHQGEGWGIVVNEAMSSACAAVVNRAVGSAPWLIKHGETGFIYEDSQLDKLLDELSTISRDQIVKIGEQAYQNMVGEWSCEVAADRFLSLAESLVDDKVDYETSRNLFASGPCSPAN
jgi:glycosyltransferase involved in cell wall biosynthesis